MGGGVDVFVGVVDVSVCVVCVRGKVPVCPRPSPGLAGCAYKRSAAGTARSIYSPPAFEPPVARVCVRLCWLSGAQLAKVATKTEVLASLRELEAQQC